MVLQLLYVICYSWQVRVHWRWNASEGLIQELHFLFYFLLVLWTYQSVVFFKKVWCVFLNLIITQKFKLITIDIIIELLFQVHVKEELLGIINTIKFLLFLRSFTNFRINSFCPIRTTALVTFLKFWKVCFWFLGKIIDLPFDLQSKFLLSSSEFFSSIPTSSHVEVSSVRIVVHQFQESLFWYA